VVFSNDLKIDELKTENRYAVVLENLFSSRLMETFTGSNLLHHFFRPMRGIELKNWLV
jgi:hypothetical protein